MPKKRLVFVDEFGIDEFVYQSHDRSPMDEKIIGEIPERNPQVKVLHSSTDRKS